MKQGRGRIGVVLYGDLTHDSRVRREVETLAGAGYEVAVVCLAAPAGLDLGHGVTILTHRPDASGILPGAANPFFAEKARTGRSPLNRLRWLVDYVRNLRSWGAWAVRAAGQVDAWHVHDFTALFAVGRRLPRSQPVLYDTHELFLETGTALQLPGLARRLLRVVEGRLVRRAVAVVTVNASIAHVLKRRYRPRDLLVVHNAPETRDPGRPRGDELRLAASIPAGSRVVLYHGALSANRGVEQLICALLDPRLSATHLCLMGFGELAESFRMAALDPAYAGRLHVLDPVSPGYLLDWIASADIGAMPLQPTTMNLRLSTPNKLFECLAAGVPVVASDFAAMRSVVMGDPDGPLGRMCDPEDVSDIARAIREIIDLDASAAADLRIRCARAAELRWNWPSQAKQLVDFYATIIPRRQPDQSGPGHPGAIH